jgi:hypothetical protein
MLNAQKGHGNAQGEKRPKAPILAGMARCAITARTAGGTYAVKRPDSWKGRSRIFPRRGLSQWLAKPVQSKLMQVKAGYCGLLQGIFRKNFRQCLATRQDCGAFTAAFGTRFSGQNQKPSFTTILPIKAHQAYPNLSKAIQAFFEATFFYFASGGSLTDHHLPRHACLHGGPDAVSFHHSMLPYITLCYPMLPIFDPSSFFGGGHDTVTGHAQSRSFKKKRLFIFYAPSSINLA